MQISVKTPQVSTHGNSALDDALLVNLVISTLMSTEFDGLHGDAFVAAQEVGSDFLREMLTEYLTVSTHRFNIFVEWFNP